MKNEFIKMEPLKVGVGSAVREGEREGESDRVAKRQIPRGGIRGTAKKK